MSNIVAQIKNIPIAIADMASTLSTDLLEGIKGVFIPTQEDLQSSIDKVKSSCESLVVYYDLKALFSSGKDITDVTATMYGTEVTIVDTDSFHKVLKELRPYIRGFLALLLVFFNVNQFLSLIGHAPVSIVGQIVSGGSEKGGTE